MDLNALADDIWAWKVAFHPKKRRTVPFLAAHLHEEASEVFKAWRDDDLAVRYEDVKGLSKPEGVASELADVILVALCLARALEAQSGVSIDIEQAVKEKLAYQEERLTKKQYPERYR